MASVNKVIIVGNLGHDPEVRYTPSGASICNVSVATTRNWKDKNTGEKMEETEWHRVVFYDKLAEIAGEYLKKGGSVYIEGRIKTRKWQDKEGKNNYTTEIIAQEMQLLGGKREENPQSDTLPASMLAPSQLPKSKLAKPSTNFDDMDDDIPF